MRRNYRSFPWDNYRKNLKTFYLLIKNFMQKKAFTLVELVVAMTIIIVLSSIWFVTYSSYIVSARNMQRQSDLAQLSSALDIHKKNFWELPDPNNQNDNQNDNHFDKGDFYQWTISEQSSLSWLKVIPTDPKITSIYYTYSVTKVNWKKWEDYQLYATLEANDEAKEQAFILGNYEAIKDWLPTLIKAGNNFVKNWDTENLVYTTKWTIREKVWIANPNTSFNYKKLYKNCDEIKKAGKFISAGTYYTLTWTENCN